MPKNDNKSKSNIEKAPLLSKKDFIIIGILSFIFTILVFFRLGSFKAPETFYETNTENRDIVLDFGGYVDVNTLHIYLGNLANVKVALSAYNEVTTSWELINEEQNVGSVFQWNTVPVNYNLRYLGVVIQEEEAVFNEFVFTGPNGIVTPVNTHDYPELFDEQELFHSTYEKTYMDGTMFDEVYHGRTGYEFVHGLPTYETTHPQLGKCIIALGIKIFGMNPFGWRFFSAIFGIIFIPLMYCFCKLITKDTFVSTCVGIFITFDCMHYTLSRIATIDIFVAFFIVLSYYYMYKYIVEDTAYRKNTLLLNASPLSLNVDSTADGNVNSLKKVKIKYEKFMPKNVYIPLMLSGIFIGFAIATKLTGVYAALGLLIFMVAHLIKYWPRGQAFKTFLFCLVFFIILPLVFYTLAYIPVVEKYAQMGSTDMTFEFGENGLTIGYGHTGLIAKTLRNTNYMLNYHKNLVATHYYSSPFYEWPLVWKPLLAANDVVEGNLVSSVSYMGNILVWWGGLLGVFFCFFRAIAKKDEKAGFLAISYLVQYIPWFSVSRITFIYHYLPSAIFSMLALGYSIKILIEKKPIMKKVFMGFSVAVILIFIIFFPVISGLPISKNWGLNLRWLPEWILVL